MIVRFEDIEAWKLARELCRGVYRASRTGEWRHDIELRGQTRAAAGSVMHNIAEGFDAETHGEFIRFLRYAKRSCSEVQSELYLALDQKYVVEAEFLALFHQADRARAAIRGFIRYLQRDRSQRRSERTREIPPAKTTCSKPAAPPQTSEPPNL